MKKSGKRKAGRKKLPETEKMGQMNFTLSPKIIAEIKEKNLDQNKLFTDYFLASYPEQTTDPEALCLEIVKIPFRQKQSFKATNSDPSQVLIQATDDKNRASGNLKALHNIPYEEGDLKKKRLKMLPCKTPTDYTTKALMNSDGHVIKTIRVLEPRGLTGDPDKIKRLLESAGNCDKEDIPFAYDNLKLTGDYDNFEPYADPSRWSWVENRLCFDFKTFYETYDSPEAVAEQKRISDENESRLSTLRNQQYLRDKTRFDRKQKIIQEIAEERLKQEEEQGISPTTQSDHDRVQAEDIRKGLEEAKAKEKLNVQDKVAPEKSEVSGASSSKSD